MRPRLPEIKDLLAQTISDALGVPIQTRPDSAMGQIIGVLAYAYADIWELAESNYYAMYPPSAEGISLDHAVSFTGVTRRAETRTQVIVTVWGSNNTTIPADSLIVDSTAEKNYRNEKTETISLGHANRADFSLGSYTAGETVSVSLVDGIISQNFTFTDAGDQAADFVMFSLATVINNASVGWTATNTANSIVLKRDDPSASGQITLSTQFSDVVVYSPIIFICEEYGVVDPQIGNILRVVSAIAGWEGVTNEVAASVGINAGTNIELRASYGRRVFRLGSASVESIRAKIYEEVDNVTASVVFENDSDEMDSLGRPPHSIEAVVSGGLDEEIARKIFDTKAAGIDTFGDIAVVIEDTMGINHTIHFNRPLEKYIWFKVSFYQLEEEELSDDVGNTIKEAILVKGEEAEIGQDVVLQRFYGPIYSATTGYRPNCHHCRL